MITQTAGHGCPEYRGSCAPAGQVGRCGKRIPDRGPIPAYHGTSPVGAVRNAISQLLRSDSELNAFALDYFPRAYDQFSGGMERNAKVTLLLQYGSPEKVMAALREKFPGRC